MADRKWSLNTLTKKKMKCLAQLFVVDQSKWMELAKADKNAFIEFFYDSNANKKGTESAITAFPQRFEENIASVSDRRSRTKKMNDTMKQIRLHRKSFPSASTPATPRNYRRPDLPLQHNLKSGKKISLTPLTGFGLVDFVYIGIFMNILCDANKFINDDNDDTLIKNCTCKEAILRGYNSKTTVYTMSCDIACKCGSAICQFVFGRKARIGGKLYSENGLRYAALTQHCKLRYSLGDKFDLYFGLPHMTRSTYRRYKEIADEKSNILSRKYMDEAIAEGIADKKETGCETNLGIDGSYNTQGYGSNLGQATAIIKLNKIDPRTQKSSKVAANYHRNRGVRYGKNHFKSAGAIETDGLGVMLSELADDGLACDIVTKDLDTPSNKKLLEVNKKKKTKTKKANDFNHCLKAFVGKGTDSKTAKGKKMWKAGKAGDSKFTHPQSKKHRGILYKRTTKILRERKKKYQKGLVELDAAFYEDTRAEMTAMLIHMCWGHENCRKAPYNKYTTYCRAKPGQKYVSKNYLDKDGKPCSYPSVQGYFELLNRYYMEYCTDGLLEALFIAYNSNVNECFNGLLCSICDKKTHISYKDYVGYIHIAIALYNVGEVQSVTDRFDALDTDINNRQTVVMKRRDEERKKKRERERSDAYKQRRKDKRFGKNENKKENIYQSCKYGHEQKEESQPQSQSPPKGKKELEWNSDDEEYYRWKYWMLSAVERFNDKANE